MGLVNRLMSAAEGAITGFNNPRKLVPFRDESYGDIAMRRARYKVAWGYYTNSIFDRADIDGMIIRDDEKLYKFTRGVQGEIKQAVDLFVSYTYKGTVDQQTLKGGSLPLRFDNKQLEAPLQQVIKWSNLDQQLATYVRDAALLGDVGWWVVDDPFRKRVRMELIDAGRVKYVERDEVGNAKAAVLEWECEEEPDVARYQPALFSNSFTLKSTKTFIKTVIVTQDTYRTYKDGKPFAFYNDVNGKPVSAWDNPYGFVPLKLSYFAEGKDGWGQNCFFGVVRRQLDELASQKSLINDSVKNTVVPLLQATGMSAGSTVTVSREESDQVAILYLPNDKAKLEAVAMPLDIVGALANYNAGALGLKNSLSILALQSIREIGGNLSGVAIQNMFGDATSSVENLRKNLDPGVASALQMAVSMAGQQGYDGFAGFNAESYDRGDMELMVAERPVIEDRLSRAETVDKIISIAKLPTGSKRKALSILQLSEDDVEEIIVEDNEEKQAEADRAMQNFVTGAFGDDGEDTTDGTDTSAEDSKAQLNTSAKAA